VRWPRLTDQEGQRLLQIVRRGKHESVRVRRAMIVMASASGTLMPAIARLVAADPQRTPATLGPPPGLKLHDQHGWTFVASALEIFNDEGAGRPVP
jgi:hypothetical protein